MGIMLGMMMTETMMTVTTYVDDGDDNQHVTELVRGGVGTSWTSLSAFS